MQRLVGDINTLLYPNIVDISILIFLLKIENISKNMSVFFSLACFLLSFLFWQTYICTIFIKLFRKLLFLDGCHLAVIDQSVLHSTEVFFNVL